MAQFQILTDSCCDLPQSLADELELCVLPMLVNFQGKSFAHYIDEREMSHKKFYEGLRAGNDATTVAVNPAEWNHAAKPILQSGKDVLILAFSSGLSTTFNSARIAAEELMEEYPDRKVLVVDSLCASLGEGLFCYHVAKQRQSGADLQQTYDYAEQTKLHLCHWFTVDDLHFLKRGGRVSSTAAAVGSLLHIKPVLHVDDEGHLIPVSKVRGRKASLNGLVDSMEKTAIEPAGQTVFISHGDCLDDAMYVAQQVKTRLGVKEVVLNPIGPVIGAHSGPGTVALFFLGTKR